MDSGSFTKPVAPWAVVYGGSAKTYQTGFYLDVNILTDFSTGCHYLEDTLLTYSDRLLP